MTMLDMTFRNRGGRVLLILVFVVNDLGIQSAKSVFRRIASIPTAERSTNEDSIYASPRSQRRHKSLPESFQSEKKWERALRWMGGIQRQDAVDDKQTTEANENSA